MNNGMDDPDLYVDYKLNDDNQLVGLMWITSEQRRAWLSHPDILIHDNTYDLDHMGFKLGNFNGIDEVFASMFSRGLCCHC